MTRKRVLEKLFERKYEACVEDGILKVPELKGIEYVSGYSHSFDTSLSGGDEHITTEFRLRKDYLCHAKKKNCKSEWFGFSLGGSIEPKAFYQCKHGVEHFGLVVKN